MYSAPQRKERWLWIGSANIVPIHKGGKKEEPLNYRAVSLRNTVVKRCEKLIKRRWTKHLEENNIIMDNLYLEKADCVFQIE